MRLNLVLLASVAVLVSGDEYQSEFEKIDSVYNEGACLQAGGVCVIAADCPTGRLTRSTGLCSEQQRRGVECCHGLSVKETRCRKNGGECINKTDQCPESLTFLRATDCFSDEKCCIQIY